MVELVATLLGARVGLMLPLFLSFEARCVDELLCSSNLRLILAIISSITSLLILKNGIQIIEIIEKPKNLSGSSFCVLCGGRGGGRKFCIHKI